MIMMIILWSGRRGSARKYTSKVDDVLTVTDLGGTDIII